jgi:phage gp29-like protein
MATPRILDQHGNPLDRSILTQPQSQAPDIGWLHRNWENHPASGLTPKSLSAVLFHAESGDLMAQCDLFRDILDRDAHVLSAIQTRTNALTSLEWEIVEPRRATSAEKEATAYVNELFQDLDMEQLVRDLADGISMGFAPVEIGWQMEGKEWFPATLDLRPQRWFRLDVETRQEYRLRSMNLSGDPLQPFGWIFHRHEAKGGYPARGGLMRSLAFPYLFKFYSARDLAELIEIYALPVRIGTYPNGATDDEKNALFSALLNIGHHAAGIIPEGMLIDFKDAAKGSGENLHLAMIDWCEKSQSKLILGGTLTSGADGKSSTNALGNVHNEVRMDLRNADAAQIAASLTRDLVYPVLQLNGYGLDSRRRCPRFKFDTTDTEEMGVYSEALPKLVSVGVQIPASWANTKLKIPLPDEGEAVLTAPAVAPPPVAPEAGQQSALSVGAGLPALGADSAGKPAPTPHPTDYADLATATLSQEAGAAWGAILDQVKALAMAAAAEGKSLAEFRDVLLSTFAGLDSDKLASAMALGYACADLAGRFDVANGN